MKSMIYDVVIVGGGPGGLAAALTLGRARKRALLVDAGTRRNAAAEHLQNFVTRDGTPPVEFRRIGREQLAPYRSVEVRDASVDTIRGERGAFQVSIAGATVTARRILLCTGMIDELPAIDALAAVWGRTAFICPYCHAWEVQDRRFGLLAANAERMAMALLLRGWSSDVVAFTNGAFAIPDDVRARFTSANVRIEERPIAQLVVRGDQLEAIQLADGDAVARDVLVLHPHQRQVPLVASLDLALDEAGYVRVHDTQRETSRPGIYAAGDLTTPMQNAIGAASAAVAAAAMLNHELTSELAVAGALR